MLYYAAKFSIIESNVCMIFTVTQNGEWLYTDLQDIGFVSRFVGM